MIKTMDFCNQVNSTQTSCYFEGIQLLGRDQSSKSCHLVGYKFHPHTFKTFERLFV